MQIHAMYLSTIILTVLLLFILWLIFLQTFQQSTIVICRFYIHTYLLVYKYSVLYSTYIHTHKHIHICIYIYMQTHKHAHTHTYVWNSCQMFPRFDKCSVYYCYEYCYIFSSFMTCENILTLLHPFPRVTVLVPRVFPHSSRDIHRYESVWT